LPAHAKGFKGKAKCIPAEDVFMLPYQSRWISDRSLMKLMEKSRRVGVSYATSYDFVREHATKGGSLDTWFSSRDEITAKEFVVYCKGFARALDAGAQEIGQRVLDDKHSAHVLRFSNGTDINSLASNPDVFAGKGGNVGLDEMALRQDPRMVYTIASPVIDWGGRMAIISTHRGSANFFNELVQECRHKGNPKGISLHRVTLQDALDQGFLWKLQTKLRESDARMQMDEAEYFNYQRSRCADEEQFLQEYMCVPGDDNAAFLSYDLIAGCEYKPEESWEHDLAGCQGELYVGVDVGRDHDLTVMWVMEKLGGVFYTRKIVEMQAERFASQEAELYAILDLPNVRRCCIDNTGLGKQFTERAQERYGTYKVEAVTFTSGAKEEMAYPVRAAFEDRSLRVPNRNEIRADLRSVKKETTASGNIRFAADRGKNGHADRFWALALAVLAGKEVNGGYRMMNI
jgi:phage FluMu gp28-like protein